MMREKYMHYGCDKEGHVDIFVVTSNAPEAIIPNNWSGFLLNIK